jgi:hypothetical protein
MKGYWEFIKESFKMKSYSRDGIEVGDSIRSPKIKKFIKSIEGKDYFVLKESIGLTGKFMSYHVQNTDHYINPGVYKILEVSSHGMYNEPNWVLMRLKNQEREIDTMILPLNEFEYKQKSGVFSYLNEQEAKNYIKSTKSLNKFDL